MKGQDAREKIKKLIEAYLEDDFMEVPQLVDKIYADVVAVAVEDERSAWIDISAKRPELDH